MFVTWSKRTFKNISLAVWGKLCKWLIALIEKHFRIDEVFYELQFEVNFHSIEYYGASIIGLGTLLFVKVPVPQPGDSKVTFLVFELRYHLLLAV